MGKKLQLVGQCALFGLIFVADKALAKFYRIEIPRKAVQDEIIGQFPVVRRKYLMLVTLQDPVIRLEAQENRVGVELTVRLDAPGKLGAQWRGGIDGSLSYDRDKGEFYLRNPRIQGLDFSNGLNSYPSAVRVFLETVLAHVFDGLPVYTLDKRNLKHSLTRLLVKSISIRDDRIILELGLY